MAQFETLRSRISLLLITLVMIVAGLGACSKSKNTAVDAAALAPVQGSSDGTAAGDDDSKDSAQTADDCEDEKAMMPGKDSEDAESDDDADLALKAEKGGKGKKSPKECPMPGTTTPSTPPAAGTTNVSLAEGQKIYAANCQSCHGALPGEKQGSSATKILGASGVGAHKGIVPWPVGAASNLSAQDAAASLAEAMK